MGHVVLVTLYCNTVHKGVIRSIQKLTINAIITVVWTQICLHNTSIGDNIEHMVFIANYLSDFIGMSSHVTAGE